MISPSYLQSAAFSPVLWLVMPLLHAALHAGTVHGQISNTNIVFSSDRARVRVGNKQKLSELSWMPEERDIRVGPAHTWHLARVIKWVFSHHSSADTKVWWDTKHVGGVWWKGKGEAGRRLQGVRRTPLSGRCRLKRKRVRKSLRRRDSSPLLICQWVALSKTFQAATVCVSIQKPLFMHPPPPPPTSTLSPNSSRCHVDIRAARTCCHGYSYRVLCIKEDHMDQAGDASSTPGHTAASVAQQAKGSVEKLLLAPNRTLQKAVRCVWFHLGQKLH